MSKAKTLIVPVLLAAVMLALVWDVFNVSTDVRMVSALVVGFVISAVYDARMKGE